MNKKLIVIIAAVIVLIGGGVTAVPLLNNNNSDTQNTTGDASGSSELSKFKAIDACDVFTLQEAQTIMGAETEVGSNTDPVTNDDLNVSTCSYSYSDGTLNGIKISTVMVRSPLSGTGVESNQEAFADGGQATGDRVEGYGDKAFWNTELYEFNILKDDVWYSIGYGGLETETRTLENARLVADAVLN